MKYLLLSVFTITLSACGSSGGGRGNVSTTPGQLPNQTIYHMQATMSEPGDGSTPAQTQFSTSVSVTIPGTADVIQDASEHTEATLYIGTLQCYYHKPLNVGVFSFGGCTSTNNAGDLVTLPANTPLVYSMNTGYCTQNCASTIHVTVTQ